MHEHRTPAGPCVDAGKASAEAGVVVLDGPDGVAVTMTADAATGTAQSLLEAAAKIRQGNDGDAPQDDADDQAQAP